jgi:eukaryotic-like serine/threonine-protein kinase
VLRPGSLCAVGSNAFKQLRAGEEEDFAKTVQTLPPDSLPGLGAGDSLPLRRYADSDSDLGSDFDPALDARADSGHEITSVAEQPTLSHIGRYALKSLLGEGGLGRVYEAWDPLLSRTVAVKTLQFDLDMPSRIALDRLLLNEARAAANLAHPNIVTVYDAGLSAHGVYIAMERLAGRDLRQAIAEGWRPSPAVAAQTVRRVAEALAYAHARGVIHCDVKPGNIFLTRKNRPKVLDFGIARVATASGVPSAAAADAPVAGSPHYIAPEQLLSGSIDARTDIYALGLVLYELLSGQKAFPGDSLEAIHTAVLESSPPPVHALRPEVPAGLSALVATVMSRDPALRPATASDLAQQLRVWEGNTSTSAGFVERRRGPAKTPAARWAAVAAVGLAAAATLAWGLRSAPPVGPAGNAANTAAQTPVLLPTAPAVVQPASSSALANGDDAATASTSVGAAALTAAAPAGDKTSPAARTPTPANKTPAAARAKPVAAATAAAQPPAAPVTGSVQIAVTPWGQVEVDGAPAGTTPPLTRLTLSEGSHTITIRNADFPPYSATVDVQADKPAIVRHRFGS